MQILLKINGIANHNVYCLTNVKEEIKNFKKYKENAKEKYNSSEDEIDVNLFKRANHSILGFELDGKNYFSDVTWDASAKHRKYFLLTKDQISKDHLLLTSRYDNSTISKIITDKEKQSLNSFAKDRLNFNKNDKHSTRNLDAYIEKIIYNYKLEQQGLMNRLKREIRAPINTTNEDMIIHLENILEKLNKLYKDHKINKEEYKEYKIALLYEDFKQNSKNLTKKSDNKR